MKYPDVYARHFARSEQLNKQWSRDLQNPRATFKFIRIVRRAIAIRRELDTLITTWIEGGGNVALAQMRAANEKFKLLVEPYKQLKAAL